MKSFTCALPRKRLLVLICLILPYASRDRSQPDLAGKITGMLLEMDNVELLGLLDSPEGLGAKVQEALNVLHEFAQKEAAIKQEQPAQ